LNINDKVQIFVSFKGQINNCLFKNTSIDALNVIAAPAKTQIWKIEWLLPITSNDFLHHLSGIAKIKKITPNK